MPIWLMLAEGPVFRFTLLILSLGLLRLALLTVGEIILAVRRSADRSLPYARIAWQTISWLVPLGRLHRNRAGYSLASFAFHIGILAASLFLGSHLEILKSNTGVAWHALSRPLLDGLTLTAIFGGGFLLLSRVYLPAARRLSRASDYILLVMLLNILVSGFVAGRSWNPIPYDRLMLFHTLNGLLVMLLIPFTKISHCILFFLLRLGSEVAWRFTPHAGERVVGMLHGQEGRNI